MTIAALGSEETVPRRTAANTVKHLDGAVGSVVANHRGASESSVVVTTLVNTGLYSPATHFQSTTNACAKPTARLNLEILKS